MRAVDEKGLRIQQLENENLFLLEKVKRLEQNVEALTQAVLHSAKKRFGASTERTPQTGGQCSFWETDKTDSIALAESPVIHIKEHKRPVRKKGGHEKLTTHLPRETVECILNPEEALCDICESEMKIIGKKKVRSEMEYIPAKLVMKDYVQFIYKCEDCGTSDEYPDDVIRSAPVPVPVLKHSVASPSIVSWIMYQKYLLSVPLYRQERDFRRMGAPLKRDTMANWVIRCAEDWLKPLYDRMHRQLLKCSIIMSDETTWQVNHEKGKEASSKSYIWIHRSGSCEGPPSSCMSTHEPVPGIMQRNFCQGFMDSMSQMPTMDMKR